MAFSMSQAQITSAFNSAGYDDVDSSDGLVNSSKNVGENRAIEIQLDHGGQLRATITRRLGGERAATVALAGLSARTITQDTSETTLALTLGADDHLAAILKALDTI